jgi:hypothetical protein
VAAAPEAVVGVEFAGFQVDIVTMNHAATKRRSHGMDLRVFMDGKYREPKWAEVDFGHALSPH